MGVKSGEKAISFVLTTFRRSDLPLLGGGTLPRR
jgi:hypothetical protein